MINDKKTLFLNFCCSDFHSNWLAVQVCERSSEKVLIVFSFKVNRLAAILKNVSNSPFRRTNITKYYFSTSAAPIFILSGLLCCYSKGLHNIFLVVSFK